MTVSTTGSRIQYSPGGSTTLFAFPYKFIDNTDLIVVLTDADGVDTTQVLTSDYTVTGAGDAGGGSITMLSPPASGTTLTIYRDMSFTQETDYVSNDSFPAETHELALDKLTLQVQQINDGLRRSIQFPASEDPNTDNILPWSGDRGNLLLAFDANGDVTLIELASITVPSGNAVIAISTPSGTATTKSITITTSNTDYSHLVKAWIIDDSNTVPTIERTLDPPDGSTLRDYEDVTTAGTVSFSFTHLGSQKSWKVCFDVAGVIVLSSTMTLGV